MNIEAASERYIAFFNQFDQEDLDRFGEFFLPDGRFKDPFNDVTGIDAIRAVFEHMYQPCPKARFKVHGHATQQHTLYLHWGFDCREGLHIDGMSRVVFAEDGRVIEHIDYWDPAAQIYEGVPILGALARWLRHRLSTQAATGKPGPVRHGKPGSGRAL